MKLGTLRYVLVRTFDEIGPSEEVAVTEAALEGDKYAFAVDGMVIHADEIVNKHQFIIDFSLLNREGEVILLRGFPYSLRGTRYNDRYIPTKKDTNYPVLDLGARMSVKLTNTDSANSVRKVAFAVLAYPVLSP